MYIKLKRFNTQKFVQHTKRPKWCFFFVFCIHTKSSTLPIAKILCSLSGVSTEMVHYTHGKSFYSSKLYSQIQFFNRAINTYQKLSVKNSLSATHGSCIAQRLQSRYIAFIISPTLSLLSYCYVLFGSVLCIA